MTMIKRLIRSFLRRIGFDVVRLVPPPAPETPENVQHGEILTHTELIALVDRFPFWQDKQAVYDHFSCEPTIGWVDRRKSVQLPPPPELLAHPGKINYGCGDRFFPEDWLNIDLTPPEHVAHANYARINLLQRHPFADSSVNFAYSEDMLEHMTQGQSIFVLSEMYRTLAPRGVLRLTFPSLEGVLRKHYTPPTSKRVMEGEFEAYEFWEHVHFYSREELSLVAKHLGFREVKFTQFGLSDYPDLSNLEARNDQVGLNLYVELTK